MLVMLLFNCHMAILLHAMKRFILIRFPKILNGLSGTFHSFQNLETVELIYYTIPLKLVSKNTVNAGIKIGIFYFKGSFILFI